MMPHARRCLLFLLPLLFWGPAVWAQHELNLPFFRHLLQTTYVNPAATGEYDFQMDMPIFPNVYADAQSTSFSFDDLTNENNVLVPEKLNAAARENNYLFLGASYDLLSFRFRTKQFWWTFTISEKVKSRFSFPGTLVDYVVKGNGHPDNINREVEMDNLGFNANYYREYVLGFTHDFHHKFTYGVRAKLLFGKANIYTSRSQMTAFSNPELLRLESDVKVNASYPDEESSATDILFNNENPGLALDAALDYSLNDQWEFSATLNDLGFIRWNTNATNFTFDNTTTFEGEEVEVSFPRVENDPETSRFTTDSVEELIGETFEPEETNESYTSSLVASSYLMAHYHYNHRATFAGGLYLEYWQGIRPSLTVNSRFRFGEVLHLLVGYSLHNRNFTNLGLGLSADLGPIQIYAVQDNSLAPFFPERARNYNISFGMNLILKKHKENEHDF